MEEGKLNDKQRAFVREYVKDWNATQAYIRAGYAPKNADVSAAKLLVHPSVAAAVEAARKAAGEAAEVDHERIIRTLEHWAYADRRDVVKIENGRVLLTESAQLTREQASLITSISERVNNAGHRSIEVKLVDPQRALDKLAEYDAKKPAPRREHSGPGGKPIEVQGKTWLEVMSEDDGEG